jgi:hypothetical protein
MSVSTNPPVCHPSRITDENPHGIVADKTKCQSALGLRAGDIFRLFKPCVIERFFYNGGIINASWRDIRGAEFGCGFIPESLIKPTECLICNTPLEPGQAWTCRPICHSAHAQWCVEQLDSIPEPNYQEVAGEALPPSIGSTQRITP